MSTRAARRHAYAAILLQVLAGCTDSGQPPEPLPIAPAPIVTDNFCDTAKKREWSVNDSPDSIREARAWNRAIDKRCGVKGD